MKKQNIRGRLRILAIVVSFFVFAFCALVIYSKYMGTQPYYVELGKDSMSYRFTYNQPKIWSERSHGYKNGMQYDLEFENKTNGILHNWVIQLQLVDGCHVDSSWNGVFTLDEETDILTITSVDYNEEISAKEMQPFGFVLYGPQEECIIDGTATFFIYEELSDIPLFWLLAALAFTSVITGCVAAFFLVKNNKLAEKQDAFMKIINQSFLTFSNTIDAKDSYTKGHSQRVAYYSRELSRRLGKSEDFQQNIFYVALLHDIGKIGIPDNILNKPGKLSTEEFDYIKKHVSIGGEILKNFNAIEGIAEGAKYHHERYDGLGYMSGLKGKDIPEVARIISVADAFDAMASRRCYRGALDIDRIKNELVINSGTQFDPDIVPYMLEMIDEKMAPIVLSDDNLEQELIY